MRYGTTVEEGTVYVEDDNGLVEIGPFNDVIAMYGETYEKTYEEWEKERYSDDLDMSDEGIESPVRETVKMMTHSKKIAESLKSTPLEPNKDSDNTVSQRMMLFLGMVGAVLDEGVE